MLELPGSILRVLTKRFNVDESVTDQVAPPSVLLYTPEPYTPAYNSDDAFVTTIPVIAFAVGIVDCFQLVPWSVEIQIPSPKSPPRMMFPLRFLFTLRAATPIMPLFLGDQLEPEFELRNTPPP